MTLTIYTQDSMLGADDIGAVDPGGDDRGPITGGDDREANNRGPMTGRPMTGNHKTPIVQCIFITILQRNEAAQLFNALKLLFSHCFLRFFYIRPTPT